MLYISKFFEGLMVLWVSSGVIQSSAHVQRSCGGWVAFVDGVSRPAPVLGPLSVCFAWVGSVDPKTEYIWSCGRIAEPGARAPIHLPFSRSVFLPHICCTCTAHARCFHAMNQIPREVCNECAKHISGWNGNVTFWKGWEWPQRTVV